MIMRAISFVVSSRDRRGDPVFASVVLRIVMDCSLPKMQKGRLIQPFACCVMASDPGAGRRRQGALGSGSGSAEIFSSALAVAAILDDVEAHLLAFVQGMHAGALDSGDVNKHIRAAIVRLNEAIALGGIEKLNNTGIH